MVIISMLTNIFYNICNINDYKNKLRQKLIYRAKILKIYLVSKGQEK